DENDYRNTRELRHHKNMIRVGFRNERLFSFSFPKFVLLLQCTRRAAATPTQIISRSEGKPRLKHLCVRIFESNAVKRTSLRLSKSQICQFHATPMAHIQRNARF